MTTTTDFPKHLEVCRMVSAHITENDGNAMWVGQGSRYPEYGYALQHGLITQEQHDAAKRWYGNLWNYAGD